MCQFSHVNRITVNSISISSVFVILLYLEPSNSSLLVLYEIHDKSLWTEVTFLDCKVNKQFLPYDWCLLWLVFVNQQPTISFPHPSLADLSSMPMTCFILLTCRSKNMYYISVGSRLSFIESISTLS